MKRKILVIEDEKPIRDGLLDLFTFHGYEVEGAGDGQLGLEKALSGKHDIIILDVMLPTKDGFKVCNELRAKDRKTPVIMLTAKTTEEDILTGLSLGADDYIAKPFSLKELILRVEAILRRTYGDLDQERYLLLGGKIEVDSANLSGNEPGRTDSEIDFTRREVDILIYLLKHQDRPVDRAELLDQIWGYRRASQIETRTVDIHIAKLRKKIETDAKNPNLLVTVRGEGYRLLNSEFTGAD